MSRSSKVAAHSGLWCTAIAALTFILPAQAAEGDPAQLLARMTQAAHTLNYEGTFVYAHGGHMQSVRIVHGVDEKGEYERLVTLSGKSREVIRNNDEVTCIRPDDKSVLVERADQRRTTSLIPAPRVEKISGHYQLRVQGHERIAGREADHVVVLPKDHYRYGHGYWIDQATGLLLRADLISDKGRLVEQVMFTSLTLLDSVPRKSLAPEGSAQGTLAQATMPPQPAAAVAEQGRWQATTLPVGFSLELVRHHPMPGKTAWVEHHVYSDGLASVSVFIEADSHDGRGFVGHSLMGATHAYARLSDDTRITVVGEVPAITVEHIASGMRPRQESGK